MRPENLVSWFGELVCHLVSFFMSFGEFFMSFGEFFMLFVEIFMPFGELL